MQAGPCARPDHFRQRPFTNALLIAAGLREFFDAIVIGKVRGGDQRLFLIAAMRDDGGYGIFHPIGDAMRAQIVEQQHFDIQYRAIGFTIGCARGSVVTRTDAVQQILVIEEQTFVALLEQRAMAATAR